MHPRVLLVTGGSRGIGAATCRLAGARGYAVAVNYRREREAAETVTAAIEAAGGRAVAIAADVTQEAEVHRLFDEAEVRLGKVTHLVNNAGIIGRASRLDQAETAMIRAVFEINTMAKLFCAREAVRRMSTRHGGAGGVIVNVSSRAAVLGSANEFIWYAGSKAAIDAITLGLAREVATEGIRVNAVAPGLIETEIHAAAGAGDRLARLLPGVPMGRTGSAEEVAEAILFLLSPAASYIDGVVLPVSGGR